MIAGAALAAALAAVPVAPSVVRLDVPAIRQAPERCGPAALEMVMRFYGADSTLALAGQAYDPALRGALITDLAAAARRAGFDATVAALTGDSLIALLGRGVPPILLMRRGIGPLTIGHYGVIVGWDPVRGRFAINDGGPATLERSRAGLMRAWRSAGSLALVVRPARR